MSDLELTGARKAAALLVSLGADASADVLKQLRDREIEQLTMEILSMDQVTEDMRRSVLYECYQLGLGRRFISRGGFDYAREMLTQALGDKKSNEIVTRLADTLRPQPLAFLQTIDTFQLVSFLAEEHPQTVALILAHLQPSKALDVLRHLPGETRAEVAMRIATMEQTPTEVLEAVESVLRSRLSTIVVGHHSSAGGVNHLVGILSRADRATERAILEYLDEHNPELSEAVRKLLFVFEDIVKLDDHSLQRLLRETDTRDLAVALRSASEELQERVFQNVSTRAAEALREDMDVAQPVRPRQVDEAKQRILAAARRLEEAGEIVIRQESEDAAS